jgi:hypothetical protein
MRVSHFLVFASLLPAAEFSGDLTRSASTAIQLAAGETAEISAGLPSPSQLPPNGRVSVEFAGYARRSTRWTPTSTSCSAHAKAGKYTLNAASSKRPSRSSISRAGAKPGLYKRSPLFP